MKRLLKLTVALVLVGALLIPAGMALAVPPPLDVDVDIKPASCPNPFNVGSKGVLSVAILGNDGFDVTHIDPATVSLIGVAPLRWALEDVAGPECSGPDGWPDLTLKFKTQEIVAGLGPVLDGEVRFLTLTGNLKAEFGGMGIIGDDAVVVIEKKVEPSVGPSALFEEDFAGLSAGAIPVGWNQTGPYLNWGAFLGTTAGGSSPEMMFNWSPTFTGISRLISPEIDATAYGNVELTFKHFVDIYNLGYYLKVQVSVDGGATWSDAWSISPTGDIGPETVTVDLSTYDGQSFRLAWVFDGYSYDIDYWYLDDIVVTGY